MTTFLTKTILPSMTELVNAVKPGLNNSGININTLNPARSGKTQRDAIKSISEVLNQSGITEVRELGIIAGIGNLLRSATHRSLVQKQLVDMIQASDTIEVRDAQPSEAGRLVGNHMANLLRVNLARGRTDCIFIEKNQLENGRIVVRGVEDKGSGCREVFIGNPYNWHNNPLVPVNCSFKASDIKGLKGLIRKINTGI